jgi:thymidylate kinase
MKETKNVKEIILSDAEKHLIETQRLELDALETFRRGYEELVQKTGFAWVVDGNSPLNNIKLGIAKISR